MSYKRRKLHESQKRAYIESGDITQTQTYKRPKLTQPEKLELMHTGTVTITYKTTITLKKTPQTELKTKQTFQKHQEFQEQITPIQEKNLSKQQNANTYTYIRWGFVIVYTDGTSSPNNEQGYKLYPGHPNYNSIIKDNIPYYVFKTSDMWQGGFIIKTWINIKKDDDTYEILDEQEYEQ